MASTKVAGKGYRGQEEEGVRRGQICTSSENFLSSAAISDIMVILMYTNKQEPQDHTHTAHNQIGFQKQYLQGNRAS